MDSHPSHDVWEKMRTQLIPFFGDGLQLVIPTSWSALYEAWFKDIEVESFRESLRYSTKELETRLDKAEVLLLFLVANERPEGVILGYPIDREHGTVFYLDTFATRTRGKGIGRIMLNSLIQWASINGFQTIELDTEDVNEVGLPLKHFYENFGFVVQRLEDDGNITMSLTL